MREKLLPSQNERDGQNAPRLNGTGNGSRDELPRADGSRSPDRLAKPNQQISTPRSKDYIPPKNHPKS